jgi:hypothetical protein
MSIIIFSFYPTIPDSCRNGNLSRPPSGMVSNSNNQLDSGKPTVGFIKQENPSLPLSAAAATAEALHSETPASATAANSITSLPQPSTFVSVATSLTSTQTTTTSNASASAAAAPRGLYR